VDALEREVARMRAAKEVQSRFTEADTRFHQTIARATGNPLFGIIGGAIGGSLTASIRAGLKNLRTPRQLDKLVTIHENIAEAIGDQDPTRASHYMAIHFDEAIARSVSSLARTACDCAGSYFKPAGRANVTYPEGSFACRGIKGRVRSTSSASGDAWSATVITRY